MSRSVSSLVILGLLTTSLCSQEPGSTFATVGRPEYKDCVHRVCNKAADRLDRYPCCAYGKTHNDMGVQSFRGTKAFLFGSACEFFTEPCRAPAPPINRWVELWDKVSNKHNGPGCSTCGPIR